MIKVQEAIGYYSALELTDKATADVLLGVPRDIAVKIEEIRLRAGRPLSVCFGGGIYFVSPTSGVYKNPEGAATVDSAALTQTVKNICGSSVYSHTDEILNGFISMPNGNRAGIVGTFRQGKFSDISSVNIRIARECRGIADNVIRGYSGGSVLVCGPPACGKTTFLRELIRGLSAGESGRPYKISLIDSRNELAAMHGGIPQNDVGVNTDVIAGRDKADGVEAALRSMSPEIIAFDEIGTMRELDAVFGSINSGAYIITTAHIESPDKLMNRNVTKRLLEEGGIGRVIFLKRVGCEPIEVDKLCG